jgi:hypothetical protein
MFIISAVLPHRLDTWVRHHTLRYPQGRDLHPDAWATTSSTAASGSKVRERAVLSLRNWMMGLALLFAAGFALADYLRYRRGNRPCPTSARRCRQPLRARPAIGGPAAPLR